MGNNWVYIAGRSNTSSRQLNIELEFTGIKESTYKAVADVTAYGIDGNSETDSVTETCVCPSTI